MKKIVIDIGHFQNDSGAVGQGFREVDINLSIANYVKDYLKYNGFEIMITGGGLKERCTIANNWNADHFISIHTNSGGGDGTEVYSLSDKGNGRLMGEKIYNEIVPKLNNGRGLKTANFYVLKNTNCSATLIETAFIDTKDLNCIDEEIERKNFGKAISVGICKFYGVTFKDFNNVNVNNENKIYRVFSDGKQVGTAYSEIENIINQLKIAMKNKPNKVEIVVK